MDARRARSGGETAGPPGEGRRRRSVLAVVVALMAVVGLPAILTFAPPSAADEVVEVSSLDVGTKHGCAVMSDQSVSCWGSDVDGQGTPPNGSFTQLATGTDFTCGLKTDQSLACWGQGQDGRTSPPAGSFVHVSTGYHNACAIGATDGEVRCWGSDEDGIVSQAPSGSFASVATDGRHACALSTSGSLACWGQDANGVVSGAPVGGGFTAVTAGDYHMCALDSSGSASCWGGNSFGQSNVPPVTFSEVSAGGLHTCGLLTDASALCWGSHDEGKSSPPPGTFSTVVAGYRSSCGIRGDGRIDCWGRSSGGESGPVIGSLPPASLLIGASVSHPISASHLGDGGFVVSDGGLPPGLTLSSDGLLSGSPTALGAYSFEVEARTTGPVSDFRIVEIEVVAPPLSLPPLDAGTSHGCAVQPDQSLSCWGNDTAGEATPPAGSFTQVATGYGYSCALPVSGAVTCWGKSSSEAVALAPSTTFAKVSVGAFTACGIALDGSIDCWGRNQYGQTTNEPAGSYVDVSIEQNHVCAVSTTGSVTCWGNDNNGQVSDAPTSGGYRSVTAGAGHSCAIRADRTVICWGDPGSGRTSPPALEFDSLSSQLDFTCGFLAAGGVACWGDTPSFGSTPDVSFAAVAAGEDYACGLRPDGRIDCWGSTDDGRSGPVLGSLPPSSLTLGSSVSHQISASYLGDGSFVVSDGDLPPGLSLSSDGLLSGMPNIAGTYSFEVEARSTGPVSDFQIVEIEVADATPALTGSVSHSVEGPLAGALVLLYAPGDTFWTPTGGAATDADGAFSAELPDGTYTALVVGPAGVNALVEMVTGVVVSEGAGTMDPVVMEPGYRLAGTVAGLGGARLEGATVHVFEKSTNWFAAATVVTSADGTFDAGPLPAGEYHLLVDPPAGSGLDRSWHGGPSRLVAVVIDVDADVVGIDVDLG